MNQTRARALPVHLAAFVLAAALAAFAPARPAAAAVTYGNDAAYLQSGWTNSYTSGALSLGKSGSGSVLIVVLGVAFRPHGLQIQYAGQDLTYLAGPVSGGDGGTAYFEVFYLANPSSGQTLTISGSNLNNGQFGAMWFTYGGVVTSGSPIGNYSINNSTQIKASGVNSPQTASFNFTPASSSSTIVEYLAIADNCGGLGGGYGVSPGTVRVNPMGQSSSLEIGGAFGDYAPGSSSTYSLAEYINPQWNCIGGLLWGIELLGSPTGAATASPTLSPSASPTPSPAITTTASHTDTPTLTPSPTASATPTVSPTWTMSGGGYPTPTPTPDATSVPLPSVYSGLPAGMRPYGLEYVPFPTVTTSSNTFYPLFMTFTSQAANPGNGLGNTSWGAPCNTARWHIVFQNLTAVTALLNTNAIKIETRIGPYGVACTTGVYDPNVYANSTSLTLPQRPQNCSTAYFWISASSTAITGGVPYTERFDAVGDPRFDPYADVLDYPGAIDDGLQGGYNWFWRNFRDTGTYADAVQDAYYQPFLPSARWDHYASQVSSTDQGENIDIPKLFGLIRDGVMVSNGIYTAMTGYDSYYAGQGGEIGGDISNNFNYGVPCFGGPWGNTNNTWNVDEIIGQNEYTQVNVNGAVYVVTGTSSTNISWASLPFLGELWPDGLYTSNWEGWNSAFNGGNTTWGNLDNLAEGGSAYRVPMQYIPSAAAPYYEQTMHHHEWIGCATFMNGTNDGSTTFNHQSVGSTAVNELNDAAEMAPQYNFSLPSTFSVTRPWALNMGGNTPPEWGYPPYDNSRTHLDTYSAATYTGADQWGFYAFPSPDQSSTTYKSAAAIRVIDQGMALTTTTGNAAGGWFIVNGLAPSTQSGINFIAQFAILACLRTFHDAGVPTGAACSIAPSFLDPNNTYSGSGAASGQIYRIPPVPLVTIEHPDPSDNVAGQTSVKIEWDERYARWDGAQYDENYPCVDANVGPCTSANVLPDPTLEWHDPQSIAFNIIYNIPAVGTAWYSALTGNEVPKGAGNDFTLGASGNYMAGADAIFPGSGYESPAHTYTYWWTSVAPAKYQLEVECFRLHSPASAIAYPHYAYHEISVDTQP